MPDLPANSSSAPAAADPWESDTLLREARAKAQRLIDSLMAQSRDMDRFAATLAPDRVEAGRRAFADAIESTRLTLAGIDRALELSRSD